jgi:hypothetical protein
MIAPIFILVFAIVSEMAGRGNPYLAAPREDSAHPLFARARLQIPRFLLQ